jgi:tRNA G18 (ribose-2'-O)-methylase SpoU
VPIPVPVDDPADAVRAALAPLRADFSVALPAFGNAFSVGAIIRVAHNFLAREIWLVGNTPHYEKASMGMEKYEDIRRAEDEEAFLTSIKGRPLYCIEKDAATRNLYDDMPFPRDVVFVFGSERFGVSQRLLGAADAVLGIPIYGVNHSLPVAVAAGIVMSEWSRRMRRGTQ